LPPPVTPRGALGLLACVLLAACETDDTAQDDGGADEAAERADDPDPDAEVVADAFAEDDDCFGLEVAALDEDEVRCGSVEVPLDHADPDGERIELAVAVLWPGRGAGR
jgi:hypothetical protein